MVLGCDDCETNLSELRTRHHKVVTKVHTEANIKSSISLSQLCDVGIVKG